MQLTSNLASADSSPYDVLDLPAFATDTEVKKQYRKKSLLIHPDKFKHEQGPEVSELAAYMLTDRCLICSKK